MEGPAVTWGLKFHGRITLLKDTDVIQTNEHDAQQWTS